MVSDVKIYDPGLGKRGYVELYVDGERFRIWSGKQLGIECNPNSFKNTEKQRAKQFLKLATAAQDFYKDNPTRKHNASPCLSVLIRETLDNFGSSYRPRYLDDIRSYGEAFLNHLEKQGLNKATPTQIKSTEVQAFLSSYNFSATYYMTARSKLSAIFGRIVKQGHIYRNPVLETTKLRVRPILHEAYSKEQITPLLCYLEVQYPNLYLCALLMYGCLLRPHEEIRLLKRSHFDKAVTTIALAGNENKGGNIRIVPLPEYVRVELIRRGITTFALEERIFGCRFTPYNRFYFSTLWTKAKPELLRLKLINTNQTLYSFRHSAAVSVFESTQRIKLVQQLLGHQSVITTEIYLRSVGQMVVDVSILPQLPK